MIDRAELQLLVASKEALFSGIFVEAMAAVDADQGFLGFVDPNDHLRIVVQNGEYWYLPANRGVAGKAFSLKETQIVEPQKQKTEEFRGAQTGLSVLSEIAVPILRGDEAVGVLL